MPKRHGTIIFFVNMRVFDWVFENGVGITSHIFTLNSNYYTVYLHMLNVFIFRLSAKAKDDEAVKHSLAVHSAVSSGNFILFFRLYKTAPNLNTFLMGTSSLNLLALSFSLVTINITSPWIQISTWRRCDLRLYNACPNHIAQSSLFLILLVPWASQKLYKWRTVRIQA